ncbi:LOW QUALITY PROTEIN: disease resistance protein At4g27190, partial [Amborella trichopoda]|uniref:LOW QUALITY PROTEIN: disease resistance protein At4g27190 n=1 Tax=Amborella trichopoda TaxID=13333 RepID=UPI0009BCB444
IDKSTSSGKRGRDGGPNRRRPKVFDGINDKSYSIIGVYGIGGVGKTTLLMNINNRFKEQPSFDTVIVVTVSATTNILNIQKKIGKRLGLDLSSCGEEDSKDKLLGALRRKKYLWHELKLESIGIPRPKNESGCKILVSSRNQDVCTDTGAEFIIEVKKLSEAEAWRLFIKRAGGNVTSPSIKPHAGTLLKKCEGPPLAINTVAHAMENRHTRGGEWEGAVRELNQSAASLRGMKEKVLDCLKFSYDRLESDMHESLFLFCALFPENCSIHRYELAVLCIGEGLVDRLGSLRATHNKVATLVGSLKSSCMLENGEEEGEVRMHDIIRELATVDHLSIVTGQQQRNSCGHPIPTSSFFECVGRLRVLDLSCTRIESLPSSLPYHLVDLRVLILRGCSCLQELPPIGGLQQLQVLDLWCCKNLKTMPDGMGDISKLRYLNLSVTRFEIHKGHGATFQQLGVHKC